MNEHGFVGKGQIDEFTGFFFLPFIKGFRKRDKAVLQGFKADEALAGEKDRYQNLPAVFSASCSMALITSP